MILINWNPVCSLFLLLTLIMLGKIFSRQHTEIFVFVFCPENRFRHFMQIVSNGDNLNEMSNPVFCKGWEGRIRKISSI